MLVLLFQQPYHNDRQQQRFHSTNSSFLCEYERHHFGAERYSELAGYQRYGGHDYCHRRILHADVDCEFAGRGLRYRLSEPDDHLFRGRDRGWWEQPG